MSLTVPTEISTKQEITTTPEGWSSGCDARPNRLSSFSISEGPPEKRVTLVYQNETRRKDQLILTWRFAASSEEGFWISCSYSATTIVLNKPLPKGIKELRAFYDESVKTDGFPTVDRIEYR